MNIQARFQELDHKLRAYRRFGAFALVGIVLLYAALLVPAIEAKPIMALGVTIVIVCQIPLLLRWHACDVERRVLARLVQPDTPQA